MYQPIDYSKESYKENAEFKVLPEGDYNFVITSSENRLLDDGSYCIVQVFTVLDGTHKGHAYRKAYYLQDVDRGAKSVQHWVNLSIALKMQANPNNPEVFIGKTVRLKIAIFKTPDNKEVNYIQSWRKDEQTNLQSPAPVTQQQSNDIPF